MTQTSLEYRSKRSSEKLSGKVISGYGLKKRVERDALKIYLDEIGHIPMLTREQEKYATREKLIVSNLRFVVMVAAKWWTLRKSGFPFEDIIQAGNEGLVMAADKFERNKGIRFISYAGYWINQNIYRSVISYCSGAHVPFRQLSAIMKGSAEKQLLNLYYYESIENLIEKAGDDAVSLESKYNTLDDKLYWILLRNAIEGALVKLKDKEREIIVRRFRLLDTIPETLDTIAKRMEVSRENIRVIQNRILRKMKPMLIKQIL